MLKFNRKRFFDAYRSEFGSLETQQVRGLEQLLGFIEADPYIKSIPEAAFLLATTKHETAGTFQPIHEYGGKAYFVRRYGGHTRKGKELGNDTPDEGFYYAGKGYPQTTGESNYEKAEVAIRREYPEIVADFERRTGKHFDLTVGDQPNDHADPMNMLDPAIAYVTMSYGSRTGMFTGRKLSHYFSNGQKDYFNARRIINGTDKAGLIAKYSEDFEEFLTLASLESAFVGISKAEIEEALQPATASPATPPIPINAVSNLQDPAVQGTPGNSLAIESKDEQPSIQADNVQINEAEKPAPPFTPETLVLETPPKDGATATTTKTAILGITVPAGIYAVFQGIQEWIEKGFIDVKEVLTVLLGLIRENIKYVSILAGLVVGVVIVKKVFKQITFIVQMLITANPNWHNLKLKAPEPEVKTSWWRFW